MAQKSKKESVADSLRSAVEQSDWTVYRIAKEAGVVPEVISRFVAGTNIRISTASKIAGALGLEINYRFTK